MGFGTILGAIAFLFIFAGLAVFSVQVQKNVGAAGSQQIRAAELERKHSAMALSIESLSYAVDQEIPWVDDVYADFEGTLENITNTAPGILAVPAPYSANGSYTSQVIDTGFASTNYTTITWSGTEPADTQLSFQVRAGASVAALTSAAFSGPDGTGATSYYVSGVNLNDGVVDANRFLQYRVFFETNTTGTPQLDSVTIGVTRPGGVVSVTVANTGSEKLLITDTDVYLGGNRVLRNDSERTFDVSAMSDKILWLPGQELEIAIFETIVPPQPIAIANSHAQAAGTVS
jgi:archaellum component FlaF (FlaF/FlaG flagellin family)